MNKKILKFLLCFGMAMGIFLMPVLTSEAANVVESGTCGENLTWELTDDGTLTISGTGEMVTTWGDRPWLDWEDRINAVKIEAGITSIGDEAFYDCDSLSELIFPEGLESIGERAFYDCNSLEKITIPVSVRFIASSAFWTGSDLSITCYEGSIAHSYAIKEVISYKLLEEGKKRVCGPNLTWELSEDGILTINGTGEMYDWNQYEWYRTPWENLKQEICAISVEEGVTTIGGGAFYNCDGLSEVILPKGLQSIGASAFSDCDGLSELILLEGLENIGVGAFYNCDGLSEVILPKGLQSIGASAFSDCDGLSEVILPKGLQSIGDEAFYDCNGLSELIFPEGLESIGDEAFYDCNSLSEVELPEGLKTIGDYAFEYCWNLEKVLLPSSLESIGYGLFYVCGLSEVILSEGFTRIENGMFYGCSNLSKINFPESLKEIGDSAFDNCDSLQEVYLPQGVTSIGSYAFASCSDLTKVVLPEGLTTIGDHAFCWCSALEEVVIPSSVKRIVANTFAGCGSLTKVTIPATVTFIATNAFDSCENVTIYCYEDSKAHTYAVSKSIPYVLLEGDENQEETKEVVAQGTCGNGIGWEVTANGTFTLNGSGETQDWSYNEAAPWEEYKEDIYCVKISEGITTLGDYTFSGFDRLTKVEIPSSVKTIGHSAFRNCETLNEVVMLGTVESIENFAFSGCRRLSKVTLPEGLKTIGDYAFYGCSTLSSVSVPSCVTVIGNSVFKGCSNLSEMVLPEGLQTIGNGAFENCSSLSDVTIPSSVKTIGSDAFFGCSSLGEITIPKSVTSIGENAFEECGNLTIYCYKNSAAYTYAKSNGLAYVLLEGEEEPEEPESTPVTEVFSDISEGAWYVNAVQYVYDKGTMSGNDGLFNPDKNVTRAQVVTTLYRLSGSPAVTDYRACGEMVDVKAGEWYTDAVCWAYNVGVATGNSDTKMFNMNNPVTRQQLAAFLYRFVEYKGLDHSETADLSSLINADKVADYAKIAVKWSVGAGIISGKQSVDQTGATVYDLAPEATATRAQLATMLQRLCEKYDM